MKDQTMVQKQVELSKENDNFRHFYQVFFKRFCDIIISSVAIPFITIIIFVFAIAIKIEDGGPVFYRSKRIGKSFKEFDMIKLRSMRVNAPDIRNSDGGTFNSENDPRVTRIGRFMRKTSIDELPQFFNVFLGQMAFVGPRAGDAESKNTYQDDEKDKMLVKPGLTGFTQAYYRNGIDVRNKRLYDAWYAHNVTIWLDIKILFKTVGTVFKRQNIYTN